MMILSKTKIMLSKWKTVRSKKNQIWAKIKMMRFY